MLLKVKINVQFVEKYHSKNKLISNNSNNSNSNNNKIEEVLWMMMNIALDFILYIEDIQDLLQCLWLIIGKLELNNNNLAF